MADSKKTKEERILKNSIQCKFCHETIESKTVHDFVTCSCGICSVDGGKEYLRRLWKGGKSCDSYIELSTIEKE